MCVAVVVASLKQKSCSSSSQAQTFGLDSVSGDTWAVKRKNLSRSCWTVPYTDSSGRAITPGDSTALVNVLCTASSRSNQVWRIQKAASRVLSTRIRTTTTPPTTAPPATTAAPSVPGAPSGLTAAAAAGSVALSWNNPSDSTITRYEVRVRPAAVTGWWCWTRLSYMGPNSVALTVSRLSGSTAYRFQLRAANARGAGAASEVAATTLAAASPPASVPAAPSGLTGAAGNRSIALSWNNPSDSSIVEYQFRERPAGESAWRCWRRIWNSTSASTGHTMGWITNGVNYQVQVRALNAAGTGPASQTAATPTATPTPRPPGP